MREKMAEQRLIDANALSKKIGNMKFEITHNRGGYRYCNEDEKSEWDKLDGFDSLVCDAPTVDAVPVVRCKDCKFAYINSFSAASGVAVCKKWSNEAETAIVQHDDFCSHGERRTDNEDVF